MSNKTLMIVDDSKVSRMMIKAIVKDKAPEMEILEAADGKEALDMAEGKDINFFSVDYNMPNMDGMEFIVKMKQKTPSARFALLTANIQDATHKKAAEIGAKCINKPISETSITTMLEYFSE